MSIELDATIENLTNANSTTPNTQLKAELNELYTLSRKHGLTSTNLIKLITFICHSGLLSEETKLIIIKKYLLPNGYINKSVIDLIVKNLGQPTSTKQKYPSKELQAALCNWLVHISILIPKYTIDLSVWSHLWQFHYLQRSVTLILIWFTTLTTEIKPWKLKILEQIALNPGYENSEAYATLILRRYLTLLEKSNRIQALIKTIDCDIKFIKVLQSFQFEDEFRRNLKKVLIAVNPIEFNKRSIEKSLRYQIIQLQDDPERPLQLIYKERYSDNEIIQLEEIACLGELQRRWGEIELPKSGEAIFTNENNLAIQFYPMVLTRSRHDNNDVQLEQFWSKMYEWISTQLTRCFQDKKMKSLEKITVFDHIMKGCQLHTNLIRKVIDEFLILENLSANKDLFMSICTIVFPIIRRPGINDEMESTNFQKKILQIINICNLSNNTNSEIKIWSTSQNTILSIVSNSIILMLKNWLLESDVDMALISYVLDILNDIRKVLLSNLVHSVENRHITITTISLLDLLSFIATNFHEQFNDPETPDEIVQQYLKQIILKNSTMNKLALYY